MSDVWRNRRMILWSRKGLFDDGDDGSRHDCIHTGNKVDD